MAEMKVIITNQQWCDMMNRIHTGRTCLTEEANELEISLPELIKMGDDAHKGKGNEQWKEWCQTKRESSKRDKKMSRSRQKTASEPTPAPTFAPSSETDPDQMEILLRKKENLQEELATCKVRHGSAKSTFQICVDKLRNTESALQKAQTAFEKAQAEKAVAEKVFRETKVAVKQAQAALQKTEFEIKELNSKKIYLIEPWYLGELPTYGTFISTVEMEEVRREFVPAEYLPPLSERDMELFDHTTDYREARNFVGLVSKYVLEEKSFTLLVSDDGIKKLMEIHVF